MPVSIACPSRGPKARGACLGSSPGTSRRSATRASSRTTASISPRRRAPCRPHRASENRSAHARSAWALRRAPPRTAPSRAACAAPPGARSDERRAGTRLLCRSAYRRSTDRAPTSTPGPAGSSRSSRPVAADQGAPRRRSPCSCRCAHAACPTTRREARRGRREQRTPQRRATLRASREGRRGMERRETLVTRGMTRPTR